MAKKEMLINVDVRIGITEVRTWTSSAVVSVCKTFNYYNAGDTTAYEKMLARVDRTRPTIDNLYKIALNIYNHTKFEKDSPFYETTLTKLEVIGYIMENLQKLAVRNAYELIEEIVSDEEDGGNTAEVTYTEARPVENPEPEPKAEAKPEIKEEPKPEVKPEAPKATKTTKAPKTPKAPKAQTKKTA